MQKINDQTNISSAEMTAYWRSLYPEISGDSLSRKLVSPQGILKAKEFEEKFAYPKIGRHVSARAGFLLIEATELLLSGNFDCCISLGSGFSLLTYYVAKAVSNNKPDIKFIDVDLSHILQVRKQRIQALSGNSFNHSISNKIEMIALDLELAYQNNAHFSSFFPGYKAPLFLIEGNIYFLTENCVQWIFNEIDKYNYAAVLFDYWPEDGPDNSACFKRVVDSIKGFIPENIKSFMSEKELIQLCKGRLMRDFGLQEIEKELSLKNDEIPQLTDKDEIILARLAVAYKK